MFRHTITILTLMLAFSSVALSQGTQTPAELGKVKWVRDFEQGLARAKKEQKPVFLLFQEVPGCSTCQCYGAVTADAQEQVKVEKVLGKGKVKEPSTYRSDPESKYYLYQSHYRFLPMTELQAVRANSLLAGGKSPEEVLSPRQIELARQIKANPKKNWKPVIGKSVTESWPWPTA